MCGGSSSRGTGEPCLGDTGELSLPSLWRIRWGTSSQCSSEWSRCVKPRSNFPVLLTTRAAAFSKRCNLSVMVLGDPANTVLQPSIRDVTKAFTRVFADSASSNRRILRINVKNFHGSLTTVVRAQNDISKTENITYRYTIFDRTYWYSPYKRRRFKNR